MISGAVWWGGGENDVNVEDIEVHPPKSTEVRVKMICASICHTDLLRANGFPLVTLYLSLTNKWFVESQRECDLAF